MGCDRMSDSTHNLLTEYTKPILDVLTAKDFEYEDIEVADIVRRSPCPFDNGGWVYCAEAGGPEPGIGCGGKGVIEAINTLQRLEVLNELHPDIVIYDILGDVVCGGFSPPIRDGFAEEPVHQRRARGAVPGCERHGHSQPFRESCGRQVGRLDRKPARYGAGRTNHHRLCRENRHTGPRNAAVQPSGQGIRRPGQDCIPRLSRLRRARKRGIAGPRGPQP
jgi:hypothetical protein